MATAEATRARTAPNQDRPARPPEHRSVGRRLLDAFEAFERLPALAGALEEVATAHSGYRIGSDIIATIESDLALTAAVLRRANDVNAGRPNVTGVPAALERLDDEELEDIIERMPTFTLFGNGGYWSSVLPAQRIHALATQRAAARVASEVSYPHMDELFVACLFHDIGKLVLSHADARYATLDTVTDLSPDRRVELERRELGVDHAVVGGVLARRWRLPHDLAHAIERHHDPAETGLAGMVRLGDMIARFEAGNPVSSNGMQAAARNVGLAPARLEALLSAAPTRERRSKPPSPLTPGEQRVLAELGKGHVYKQIAQTLGLSVSTVRTHLYNTYKKLGVADRAQATLLARENNWI